ncbi:uncharacterized protein N7511_004253 [Penicillium nucicola]|uniref:uncharacterized protein n=1 Tax=Penicillium nucicola TaxID=1850975 RepID=UPI002544E77C|nr:uncharacterized protein N7511_004253 [Penicillium nucicola]KAJ5766637.1 hypothetical protein N7511_004253 [Penicillium nucicola]
MLIDGQKWACEACIRGHRVTSCKHHDRPLIRIKRKGRPFATCTICNATPCTAPIEHARAKRDAELKCSKKAPNGRLHPRHHNTTGFLPIAPRPGPNPGERAASVSTLSKTVPSVVAKSKSKSASGSRSGSISASSRPSRAGSSASLETKGTVAQYYDAAGVGEWSGSEVSVSGSVSGAEISSKQHGSFPELSWTASNQTVLARSGAEAQIPLSDAVPSSLVDYSVVSEALFNPTYSLLPSSSVVSDPQLAQTLPLVSPLERLNPFEFPLDPALALEDLGLGSLDEVDMSMDLDMPPVEEGFHVEDWSRYMWSPETGFEHLDMGTNDPVLR